MHLLDAGRPCDGRLLSGRRGAKAKENSRDSTNKARGLFGARRYGVSELSGSRPAELTVAEEWVNAPETPAQQTYLENEADRKSVV